MNVVAMISFGYLALLLLLFVVVAVVSGFFIRSRRAARIVEVVDSSGEPSEATDEPA